MTFEEKLSEFQDIHLVRMIKDWRVNLVEYTLQDLNKYALNNYPCLFNLQVAIKQGDIEKVRENVKALKPLLLKLQKALKLYNSYKGEKEKGWFGESILYFKKGVLIIANNISDKEILLISRMLRDAEVRCLKHPRHR